MEERSKIELDKGLNAAYIKSRSQGGQNLSYIEAHHAIREANRIFGFDGWTRQTHSMNLVQSEQKADKWYVGYTCAATITAGGTPRDGFGFGQGIDKDLGRAHESAIKEAESDAMKRAMMTFGDPFGLALYDKKQEHVERDDPAKPSGKAQPLPTAASEEERGRNAGLYMRRDLGMDKAKFGEFQAKCTELTVSWLQTALDAEQQGVVSFNDLMNYAAEVSAANAGK